MRSQRTALDLNTLLWWISLTAIANIVGLVVAQVVFVYVVRPLFGFAPDEQSTSVVLQLTEAPLYAVGGAIAGAGQWLVLRRLFPRAGWWVLATAGGWMAGSLWSTILFPAGTASTSVVGAIIALLLLGLCTGICQWLVLRIHYERSELWVPVATLAITVGTTGWLAGGTIFGGVLLLASGALGGWTLMRVLVPKKL
jgi:hypothetical protein